MKSVVVCLLALAGVADLVAFSLGRILQPQDQHELLINRITLVCITMLFVFAGACFVDSRRFLLEPTRWFIILIIAIFVITLAPHLALRAKDANLEAMTKASRLELLSKYEAERTRLENDLRERLAIRKPYGFDESLELLSHIRNWDLSTRGLPDHTEDGLRLLRDAIEFNLFDPAIKGPDGTALWRAYSKSLEDLARQTHTDVPVNEAEIIKILKARTEHP
jgi:hypothetical protein